MQQNEFGFLDNYLWNDSGKFCLLWQWRGYYSSAVNLLTSSPSISDATKNNSFWLNLAQNHESVR